MDRKNGHLQEERLAGPQLLEMLGLESVEMMIRKKTLQRTAHCARKGESDLTWRRMRRELEDDQSQWGQRVRVEWKKMDMKSRKQWCAKVEDCCWLASKLGGNKKKGDATTTLGGK